MRIRNRPTPSIYPPPPDLKLNRRSSILSPPPQPKKQLLPALLKPQPPAERQLRGSDHDLYFSDQTGYTTNFVSDKKSSPDDAAAASTDDNDDNDSNNNTTGSWKDESIDDDTGVQLQPFSHTDEGTVRKGATGDKRGSRVGAALTMEGSRCSRVNGRGWRCGQQTIVGYSLCEHHLGKSRLRSLTSVKNITTSNKDNFSVAPSSSKKNRPVEETDDDDDDEPLLISNGRKKSRIGTVKARSLSSLLGQTSQLANNGRR